MAEEIGRKSTSLKRILGQMAEGDYINTQLVISLRDWDKGLRERKFTANAQTEEQAIARTELLMKGIGDNTKKLAEGWVNQDGSVSPDSEAGLRARLSDEMAFCLRRGGVLLPTGELRRDLPTAVEQVIYELKPELRVEVQKELSLGTEGQNPTIIEGNYTKVV